MASRQCPGDEGTMHDDEIELLERELREAKEELVRREREDGTKGLVTTCPSEFKRLTRLGPEELEKHIERLERDIEDRKYAKTWPPRDYKNETE